MRRETVRIVLIGAALSLAASSCVRGDTDPELEVQGTTTIATIVEEVIITTTTDAPPFAGTDVLVTGPAADDATVAAMNEVLGAWAEPQGIAVEYRGEADWGAALTLQVRAGAEPDITLFESASTMAGFHRSGALKPAAEAVQQTVDANWSPEWRAFGEVDGVLVGVPIHNRLESAVWYQPGVFAAKGYQVPQTFDELLTLATLMIESGDTPLCVGLESGVPDKPLGTPATAWIGDLVLSASTPGLYDAWVQRAIPANDERIVAQMQALTDFWNTPGIVFGGTGLAAETDAADHAQDLYDQRCLMQRADRSFQEPLGSVSTLSGEPVGFADGSPEAFDVFGFPSNQGTPIQASVTTAAAFADRPEVWAVLDFMASPDFVNQLQQTGTVSGVSSALGVDINLYSPLQQSFVRALANASVVRPAPNDVMIPEIGEGVFPAEATAMVLGQKAAPDAANAVEAAWAAATG